MAHGKGFLILGNINAITYKEVFPLIRDDRLWLGASIHSGDRKFYVPDSYEMSAAGCGTDEGGSSYIRVKGVRWFTNLEHACRHGAMRPTTPFDPADYPRYDNYDAIDVARCSRIPKDYDGLMGVPITYIDKYDPDEFEIVMLANGNARTNVDADTLALVGYRRNGEDRGGVGVIGSKRVYARLLIRRRA